MSKKNKRSRPAPRAEPAQKRSIALVTQNKWETLECLGYTSLAQNPEICGHNCQADRKHDDSPDGKHGRRGRAGKK